MSYGPKTTAFKSITALTVLGVLLCFVLWVYHLGQIRGEYVGIHKTNAKAYAADAQIYMEKCLSADQSKAKAKCIREIIEATNEHQRAESNHQTLKQIADAAFLIFAATAVMAILTGFGVVYVARSLAATQHIATNTRRIDQAQVRACLVVENVTQKAVARIEAPTAKWRYVFHATLRNLGATAACQLSLAPHIRGHGITATVSVDPPALAGNQSAVVKIVLKADAELTDSILELWVSMTDIFQKTHQHSFAYQISDTKDGPLCPLPCLAQQS